MTLSDFKETINSGKIICPSCGKAFVSLKNILKKQSHLFGMGLVIRELNLAAQRLLSFVAILVAPGANVQSIGRIIYNRPDIIER